MKTSAGFFEHELAGLNWVSLGYFDYPDYAYIKNLKRNCQGINSHAALEAVITPDGIVSFYPKYKKIITPKEAEYMLKLAAEFMRVASKYGVCMEWRYEAEAKDRNKDILKLRKEGLTFSEIGRKYDLSTSRIQQICEEETA